MFGNQVTASRLYIGKRWQRASQGLRRLLSELVALLLGGSILLCALQMLS
jgi:hypothetical protein